MREAALVIRDATLADHASIVEFNAHLALETERKILDRVTLGRGITKALADPSRLRYWLAERSGRVIGQAAITREWSDWRNGWIWWFQSVFVHQDARGQGVFRALYRHIRDQAQTELDVIGLRLYVEEHNHRAQQTYQALGMKAGGYQVYEELWIDRFNRPSD